MENAKMLFFITAEKVGLDGYDDLENYGSSKITNIIIYTISQLVIIKNGKYKLIGFSAEIIWLNQKHIHKGYWIDAYYRVGTAAEGDFFDIKLEDYVEKMFVYSEKVKMVKSLDKVTIYNACREISNSSKGIDDYDCYISGVYFNIEDYLNPTPNAYKTLKDNHIKVKLEDNLKLTDFLLENNRNILKDGQMLVIHIDDIDTKKYLNLNKTYRDYDHL